MVRLLSISVILITAFTINHDSLQNKYKLHGKHGLFIKEKDQKWEINWRTPVQEKGELIVYENDTKTAEYHTESSIIHKLSIPITDGIDRERRGINISILVFHQYNRRTDVSHQHIKIWG